jgi:hypothetical protein
MAFMILSGVAWILPYDIVQCLSLPSMVLADRKVNILVDSVRYLIICNTMISAVASQQIVCGSEIGYILASQINNHGFFMAENRVQRTFRALSAQIISNDELKLARCTDLVMRVSQI